jgi:hypothetical protein
MPRASRCARSSAGSSRSQFRRASKGRADRQLGGYGVRESDAGKTPSELPASGRPPEQVVDETGVPGDPDVLTPEILNALDDNLVRARIEAGLADAEAGRVVPLEEL